MNCFDDMKARFGETAADVLVSRIGNFELPSAETSVTDIDRCNGALIGFAIGETLGAGVEEMSRDEISSLFPHPSDVIDAQQRSIGTDTVLALITADSVLSDQVTHPERFASRLQAAQLNTRGRSIPHTQEQLRQGASWWDAALIDSAGVAAAARSIIFGLVWSKNPTRAAYEAALSASVTHGHPMGVSSAAAFAAAIALATTEDSDLGQDWVRGIEICSKFNQKDVFGQNLVERLKLLPSLASQDHRMVLNLLGTSSLAHEALPAALWCATNSSSPVDALMKGVYAGGDTDTITGMIGALLGARFGASIWSNHLLNFDGLDGVRDAANRISTFHSNDVISAKTKVNNGKAAEVQDDTPLHISFLIDRSGSMRGLEVDVVEGFNTFLSEQKSETGACEMTLVQFDDVDPFEIMRDSEPINKVAPISQNDYQPRSMTPLYDAIGTLIERVDTRVATKGLKEDQVVAVFTDGHENASRRWEHAEIFELIKKRKDDGWTFIFMGANQDSYATGGRLGFDEGSIQNYRGDSRGTRAAMASFSRSVGDYRRSDHVGKARKKQAFYDGVKEAEIDHNTRA